jgi:ribonuclease BN (tRNA processing enzyme)
MNGFFQAVAICLIGAAPGSIASAQAYNTATTTSAAMAQTASTPPTTTTIVFLGTGMPRANPKRQGPAFVVQAGGNTYLFDIGVGVMRQATAANVNIGPPTAAFLSHLHTDHTLGLPDLMFTAWSTDGAKSNFPLYGPVGLQWMVDHIQKAYAQDICVRNVCQMFGKNNYQPPAVTEIKLAYPKGGPSPPPTGTGAPTCSACNQVCPAGQKCTCGDDLPKSAPQQVYADSAVRVSAFLVRHGCWDEALGYVIETLADKKRIVYSGDTRYVANMGAACNGCDVLIHELYWGTGEASCGNYMTCFHTTVNQLQQVFKEGKPKKLVVVHQVGSGTASELGIPECSSTTTSGCVIFANDLQTVTP